MSKLIFNDLRIWVHLGCSHEEKVNKQVVSIDVEIEYNNNPAGIYDDNLDNVLCYKTLIELIQNHIRVKEEYNLIEHIAFIVHETVVSYARSVNYEDIKVTVRVKKISSLVPGLCGNVSFILN